MNEQFRPDPTQNLFSPDAQGDPASGSGRLDTMRERLASIAAETETILES